MNKFLFTFISIIICCGLSSVAKNISQPDTYAYTRGVEAYDQENYADALDWFNRELSEHPDNGYAYFYIGAIRYGNEEYGKALSAIDNAIKKLPKKDKRWYSTAYASRADVYAAMEDTVKALNDLAQAIKIDGSNKKFYSTRGQIYYEQKNFPLSDTDYRKMVALDAGDVMGHMGIGRNANAQKNWNDAIAQFNQVVKLAPGYSSGYSFRADAYIGQEKWNEATDDIIKALDIDGDNKALYLLQNIPDEAYDLLKSKLKIQMAKQPSNNVWPYYLATLAQLKKNYTEAIAYLEQAHSLDANSIFLEKIARCYLRQYDLSVALEYANSALDMSPEDYDVIDLKADILSSMGRYEECLAERDRYVARYPEYFLAYMSRANDYMNARRFEDAIEDYNMVIVLAPFLNDAPSILMRRGDAYRLTGKHSEAEKDYNNIIEAKADSDWNINSYLPFAYSGLQNEKKAIETMQYIIDNDTTDLATNYYNLACIYARLNKHEEALQALKTAFQKGYKEIAKVKSDYNLDGIRNFPEYAQLIDSLSEGRQILIIDASLIKDETSGKYETIEVPFTKEGGVTTVKCTINGLPLHFVFDTGAADVTISMVEANFMLKNNYFKMSDIVGSAHYMDANGNITEGTVINIRNVNFGGLELDNVRASVVRNQKAPLLLGQSVLGRLGKIEIDNNAMKLVITHKVNK